MIYTERDSDQSVWNCLIKMKEIKEAYTVYGVCDIIARVEADTMQELKEIVSGKIRKLEGIRSTLNMNVIS